MTASGDKRGAASYLTALRQHVVLIVGLVIVAVVAAGFYAKTTTKRYQAEADVLVSPVDGSDTTFLGFSLLRTSVDPDARAVITAARIATSNAVADRAAAALHTTRAAALGAVSVTPLSQGNIVAIVGKSSSGPRAAAIANTFVTSFLAERTAVFQQQLRATISRLRAGLAQIPADLRSTSPIAIALQTRLGTLVGLQNTNDPTLELISKAPVPLAPVWPRPTLSVAVAFVAALLIGIGLAIALEFVSPKIKREDELILDHGLPILARIPMLPRTLDRGPRGTLPADMQESYRTLRASLAHAGKHGGFPSSLLVTSASPGEGKTMTSVNLAITLARSGSRVVLIDGDLRRPRVASYFNVAVRPGGFANVLAGTAQVASALVTTPFGPHLRLLPASPDHAQRVDALRSEKVAHILIELKRTADVVIIDSPPLTEVADALTLADAVEGVLVAVRLGRSSRDRLVELRRAFALRGLSPLGFVLTTRTPSRGHGYFYGSDHASKQQLTELFSQPPGEPPQAARTAATGANGRGAQSRPTRGRTSR